VETRVGRTFVDLCEACASRNIDKSRRTHASVTVLALCATATLQARSRLALVDVIVASLSAVPWLTCACESVREDLAAARFSARSFILAWR
jgi:hypothetical protein